MNWIARDTWFGVDKVEHIVWSIAYWTVLTPFSSGWEHVGSFAAGAVGVELVQLYRFWRWFEKGQPQPRPAMCDPFSWKDLIADAVGALIAVWCLARVAG